MNLEEYQKLSFVPIKANLEKRISEQDQAALQNQQGQRKSISDISEDPLSTTSTSPRANSHSSSRPEVRRLSGNFNAPTYVEVERYNDTKSRNDFKGIVKGWLKRSPPPTLT